MTTKRKTALVVCPGRGSYQKSELGYLQRHHADQAAMLASFDDYRLAHGQLTLSELDGADRHERALFDRGDNASALIYACAYADFLSIDRQQYDIVGITGNSMGWYIALACGGALANNSGDTILNSKELSIVSPELVALHLINSMGKLMHEQQTGGQLIYPLVDEYWQIDERRVQTIKRLKHDIQQREGCELHDSIRLSGFEVLAGNETGLKAFARELNADAPYPIRLAGHGAYHSPMMQRISEQARHDLSADLFAQPNYPLIDGRGQIWQPHSSDPASLWDYTLGTQIVETYDFSIAIQNALKELAPDCLILLGPGNSLGAVTAQALLDINWQGMSNKRDFTERQANRPIILSMGLSDQRPLVERENRGLTPIENRGQTPVS